jgi:hypothetical protein
MMPRGGKREGAPGKSYANRSDMNMQRMPSQGLATPAAGGMTPPAAPQGPAPQQMAPISPDQTPNLGDPGSGQPVTAGLNTGPGPGSMLTSPATENVAIGKYLPDLQNAATMQGAPDSFKILVRYLMGQA